MILLAASIAVRVHSNPVLEDGGIVDAEVQQEMSGDAEGEGVFHDEEEANFRELKLASYLLTLFCESG